MRRSIVESGTAAPLETEDEDVARSDHRTAFVKLTLTREKAFRWQKYSYRHYDDQAEEAFKGWVVMHDWREVAEASGSEEMTNAYQGTLQEAIEACFPLRTTTRKDTDLPWMSKDVLKEIKTRKRIFAAEGGERTAVWKEAKKKTGCFSP